MYKVVVENLQQMPDKFCRHGFEERKRNGWMLRQPHIKNMGNKTIVTKTLIYVNVISCAASTRLLALPYNFAF